MGAFTAVTRRWRIALLVLLTVAVGVLTAALPPVPQWPSYHDFADRRAFLGLPNFLDVASNALFMLAGATGLYRLLAARRRPVFLDARERRPWLAFFLAMVLLGPASAWYHLEPSNERLFWDRLAMTAVFMSWFSAQLAERIGVRFGLSMLPALLLAGTASVIYWIATESAGAGDLRAYGVVHFYPALLIPLLMLLFPPRYSRGHDILIVLGLYGAALLAEWLDRAIFDLAGLFSGHTLKHLLAALAAWRVLHMLRLRQTLVPGDVRHAPP